MNENLKLEGTLVGLLKHHTRQIAHWIEKSLCASGSDLDTLNAKLSIAKAEALIDIAKMPESGLSDNVTAVFLSVEIEIKQLAREAWGG